MKIFYLDKKFPKASLKFCQKLNNPQNIAKEFEKFAKVAKFRKNWSHCNWLR